MRFRAASAGQPSAVTSGARNARPGGGEGTRRPFSGSNDALIWMLDNIVQIQLSSLGRSRGPSLLIRAHPCTTIADPWPCVVDKSVVCSRTHGTFLGDKILLLREFGFCTCYARAVTLRADANCTASSPQTGSMARFRHDACEVSCMAQAAFWTIMPRIQVHHKIGSHEKKTCFDDGLR